MAKIQWNKAQQQAIESINTNALLNAGAGSGKTAVLSEHVIFLLKNGYRLNQLLIVTFTNLAANEMKQRIKSKIEKDTTLNDLYKDEIESAHIETFDAFFYFLVKKYHYVLGINQNIDLIDTTFEDVLKKLYLDNYMDELYEEGEPDFIDLIHYFCMKNDEEVKDAVLAINKAANLSLDKNNFYDKYVSNCYNEQIVEEMITKRYQEMMNCLDSILSLAENLESDKDKGNIIEFISKLKKSKDYDELYYNTTTLSFPRKTSDKTNDKDYRNSISAYYKSVFVEKAKFGYKEDIKNNYLINEKYTTTLVKIAKELDDRLNQYKVKHNVFTFDDIAKMALKITENEDILKEIKDEFRYILVDEYQDTSDIQEAIIKKIENNNVFMVGDVKQSIYRFRNANCLIFQNKYERYKNNPCEGQVIDMTENFRSRPQLVEHFNAIFSQLMVKKNNIIDYVKGHYTSSGLKAYNDNEVNGQSYGVNYINYYKPENVNKYEYEARIIVEDIVKKINNKYQVYDSKIGLRDCQFSDFAIIMDRGTNYNKFKKIFNEYNVPLYVLEDEKIKLNEVALLTTNLLKAYKMVLNNELSGPKFRHAYCSIARSFLCNFDDEIIYHTIKSNDFSNDPIVVHIKNVINLHQNDSLKAILIALYDEFDIYQKISLIGDYQRYSHIIDIFLSIADNLDNLEYDVDGCVAYFDDIENFDAEIKANSIKESDNSVILLNIHKSKGLEFSICYYAGLSAGFYRPDLKKKISASSKYGLVFSSKSSDFNSLSKKMYIDELVKEDVEERLRLFYVALTRAKEVAYIINECGDENKLYLKISDVKSLHDFSKFYDLPKSKKNDFEDFVHPTLNRLDKIPDDGEFILYNLPTFDETLLEQKRASKQMNEKPNEDVLAFGNKMHFWLEMVDFDNKDLSFISDEKERSVIKKVIDLPIFKNISNSNIHHEFIYFDSMNNINGIIDCLLIKDSEIDIIDFKLKNIDDSAYLKQLKMYHKYIAQVSSKKIRTFLISILDANYKEVDINE